MMTGFACLAVSGLALALGIGQNSYLWLLPGLLLYGIGLSIVLTVNDPVTLDSIPEADHGQAAGVAATAEQGGGALGIAILYAIFTRESTRAALRISQTVATNTSKA